MSTCRAHRRRATRRRAPAGFQADAQDRRLRRLLRAGPPALRRRPAPVQARPDGAPRAHLRRAPRRRPTSPPTALRLKADADELDAFLDRVTINVSQLWRHQDQWTRARPRRPARARRSSGRVRCWSAGSSYGAEAYTLAAVAARVVPNARVEIHGTDLDRRMVARARAGRFSAEDARTRPAGAAADAGSSLPMKAAGRRSRSCMRMTRFEVGDLLRMPVQRAATT